MYSQKDIDRFWSKVETGDEDECWNWTAGVNRQSYGKFWVNDKTVGAHRFSYQLKHNRLIDDGMCILHSCNNPICVNPTHLSEGTNAENSKYMVQTGRSFKGEKNPASKITEAQVLEIRAEYAKGETTHRKLGKEYGICHSIICDIINRKTWQHI